MFNCSVPQLVSALPTLVPAPSHSVPASLTTNHNVFTLLHVSRFHKLLSVHPDTAFSNYFIVGLTTGYTIGYQGSHISATSPNLASSKGREEFISTYLSKCVDSGQTAGPFPSPPKLYQCEGLHGGGELCSDFTTSYKIEWRCNCKIY